MEQTIQRDITRYDILGRPVYKRDSEWKRKISEALNRNPHKNDPRGPRGKYKLDPNKHHGACFGHKVGEAERKGMSERMKETHRKHPNMAAESNRNRHFDYKRRTINNGIKEYQIRCGEPLPEGFVYGRLPTVNKGFKKNDCTT